MKKPFLAVFIAAATILPLLFSGTASAQFAGLSDSARAQLQQIRIQAKTAAFNDLTPDHRSKVQAIVDQVDNQSLDRDAAARQIDAVLTPAESQAVLVDAAKARQAMRQVFEQNAGGAAPMGGDRRGGERRQPDAGRSLLMLSVPFRRHAQ